MSDDQLYAVVFLVVVPALACVLALAHMWIRYGNTRLLEPHDPTQTTTPQETR